MTDRPLKLWIRIEAEGARLGPGKIRLLELIGESGSISAAGRRMKMSYRRAWSLVADLNATLPEPVVIAQPGGRHGGGAALTAYAEALVRRYRDVEAAAMDCAEAGVAPLLGSGDPKPPR